MVARASDIAGARSVSRSIARIVDRWIFVFMAALFVATALIGFAPTSIARVAAAQAGARPIPSVLHVHAVLMGAWLLLLAQTWLMASGRPALHEKLGIASIALVPAMVVAGVILAPTLYAELWGVWQSLPLMAVAEVLWGSPWWLATAPRIFGMQPW